MKALTLSDFLTVLGALPAAVRRAEQHGLREGAQLIEQEAKDLIGTEYAGWPVLADSTIAEKQSKGQTGRISSTDPLFATGELHAVIGHRIEGNTAIIGTPDPVGVFHEFGTTRMPPRPFLAPAAHRKGEDAANQIGKAVQLAMAGERVP